MKQAIIAATAYCLALFGPGFVLGTMRVVLIMPRIGEFAATLLELPVMLTAAFFACRWAIRRWKVPNATSLRLVMASSFLALLLSMEMLLGIALFGRTMAEQWAAQTTPAGLLGLTAQCLAALLPMYVANGDRT